MVTTKFPAAMPSHHQKKLVSNRRIHSRMSLSFVDWLLEQEEGRYFVAIDNQFLAEQSRSPDIQKAVKRPEELLSILLSSKTSSRGSRDADAIHMYGLIHKKYIATEAGMQKMLEKRATGDLPKCKRYLCHGCVCVPVGMSDEIDGKLTDTMKMFCPNCTDFYQCRTKVQINGCYFGKEWVHQLVNACPEICGNEEAEQYEPRVFGFKVSQKRVIPAPL